MSARYDQFRSAALSTVKTHRGRGEIHAALSAPRRKLLMDEPQRSAFRSSATGSIVKMLLDVMWIVSRCFSNDDGNPLYASAGWNAPASFADHGLNFRKLVHLKPSLASRKRSYRFHDAVRQDDNAESEIPSA